MKFASFAESREDLYAFIMAASSFKTIRAAEDELYLAVPDWLIEEWNRDETHSDLDACLEGLNVEVLRGFSGGLNPKHSFRMVISFLGRKLGHVPVCFFEPRVLWRQHPTGLGEGQKMLAAAEPYETWPKLQLYGPKRDEIWQFVATEFDTDINQLVKDEFPNAFWRYYQPPSTRLFIVDDFERFAEGFDETVRALEDIKTGPLESQIDDNRTKHPALAVMLMRDEGEVVDMSECAFFYDTWLDMRVRLQRDDLFAFVERIDAHELEPVLKTSDRLKLLFIQGKGQKIASHLEDEERDYPIPRVREMIDNRGLQRQLDRAVERVRQNA